MGFWPTKVNTNFWIRRQGYHYEYLVTYVDDILAFSQEPMKIINDANCCYLLKGVGAPEYYLRGNIDDIKEKQWQEEGVFTALSARTYIENVMEKLEKLCDVEQFQEANSPMSDLYHPKMDDTPLLDDEHASK
jgi:hypothetical protein